MITINCEICGDKIDFSEVWMPIHLELEHQMDAKDYYDTYISKADKMCRVCGKVETHFISLLKGYEYSCATCHKKRNKKTRNINLDLFI